MRTKFIPAGVMLLAGAVTCIISIVQQQDINKSLITLLVVLVLFYVIGLIAKFFVEKILNDFKTKEDSNADEENTEAREGETDGETSDGNNPKKE